jgi:hypothetical protein
MKKRDKTAVMRRRDFVSAAAAVGAVGVTGCIDGGDGDDGNETDGNETDNGDGGEAAVTGTSFDVSSVRGGDVGESASYSFEDGTLRVTGVIVGSDACKTAELGDARYDGEREAVVVDVVTTDSEDAGDVCAQVLTPIRYEATVEVEYDEQPGVVVTHDGEEVDASEGTGRTGGGTGTRLTDSEFEVTGSSCGTETEEAEYTPRQPMSEDNQSTGVVEGTLSGPDSCTTAELGYVSYDGEEDTLVADVRRTSTDEDACEDCITEVDYRLEATFENGVPDSASVSHDGVRLDAVGEGIENVEFSVEGRENASGDEGSGDAEFDEEGERIIVTGAIIGNNGCATARLAEAVVEDGSLNVDVETVSGGGDVCTDALVAIRYEMTVGFDGEIPNEVSLSHNGQGVMSGAYGSQSVSESPEGNGTDD